MKTQTLILALAAVVFSTGCMSMKTRFGKMPLTAQADRASSSADQNVDLPEFKAPEKMLAIWKDSVRSTPGKPTMRGFGGRIFLYDQSGEPIRAQGELVVYGFDDSVKDREGSKADQKIVLRNSNFQKSYSKSGLGHSYNVWFEWDEVGGPEKSVTLVPFFRTPEGKIVKAGQSIYTLRSAKSDTLYKEKLVSHEGDSDADAKSVSHANYLQSDDEKNAVVQASGLQKLPGKKKSVRTTTIIVPKETQQRLRESSFGVKGSKETTDGKVNVKPAKKGRPKLPSRLDEARKKRLEEISKGNIFGLPGQL